MNFFFATCQLKLYSVLALLVSRRNSSLISLEMKQQPKYACASVCVCMRAGGHVHKTCANIVLSCAVVMAKFATATGVD